MKYQRTFDQMRRFSTERTCETPDEFWLLQHFPVYTRGYSCTDELLEPSDVPVIPTDRGGQMTYHGPGQLVIYLLLDIKRRNQGIRNLVSNVESAVVSVLESYGVRANTRPNAPGVYVDNRKIASLGIRITRGCSYHGLSLNVDMDTTPFEHIVVCGMSDLEVVTMRCLGIEEHLENIADRCVGYLRESLGYSKLRYV